MNDMAAVFVGLIGFRGAQGSEDLFRIKCAVQDGGLIKFIGVYPIGGYRGEIFAGIKMQGRLYVCQLTGTLFFFRFF